MEPTATKTATVSQGHPTALYILFLTEMWERFSYYGMRAILFLYMIAGADKNGMGLGDAEAGAIYGLYTASVYLLSLPGGWLADNVLGQKKSIWYGGIVIMLGHIILAIQGSNALFFSGLAVVAFGTGLLKPNISSIVGELYPEGGARRDAGFSIFYMGINLGGAIGMLTVGYLGEKVDWHTGFGAAAVAMFLGLVIFRTLGARYLKPYGELKPKPMPAAKNGKQSRLGYVFAGMAFVLLTLLQLSNVINIFTAMGLAKAMGLIIVLIAGLYFAYILVAGGLTPEEKKRVWVMLAFFLAASLFWAAYEQGGSTLNAFSERHTNRNLLGWEVPASWLQFFQSAFVIVLAPVMAAIWLNLGKRGQNPPAPVKFGIGLIILGLGFLVMYQAAQYVVAGSKVSMGWLTTTFLLSVLGELCISPVGLSFYTKLSPPRYMSQFMGIWFVASSLGNLIAGLFSGLFEKDNFQQMPQLFLFVVVFTAGFGLLMLILNKPLKKWMGGVE
jgi:POT family proton-dependent oligopeptide transporter